MLKDALAFQRLLKLSNEEANKCFDKLSSFVQNRFVIDVCVLDDILHERFGDYEEEDKSMEDIIKEKYGDFAVQFVINHL